MGEELTGVTLGGFGGRSPPFSLSPRPPSSSFSSSSASPPSLPGFLQWRWAAPHAAAVATVAAKAAGGQSKNSAWCFSEQVPPAATPNNGNYRHHLRLKQASCRPGGLWGGAGGGGWVCVCEGDGWPDNEAASDHPEHRPATNEQHSRLKAFIKIIHYSKK